MKIANFAVEQWMNDYEGKAVYNMTDTCVAPLSYQELLTFDTKHLLSSLTLDYGVITGDERLKTEILKMYQTGTINQITMAQGCLQANQLVMETLLEEGDTVIAYTPSYQQFTDYPKSLGCHVIVLPLYEECQWQPKIEELKQAFQQPIKLVILNNPNNPTGSVFSQEYLHVLYQLAQKNGTYILSDEVYRDPSRNSISDEYDNGISTSSLSKLFSLAGLRSGWIKGPQEVIDAINVRRDYAMISTGPLSDTLSLLALENKEQLLQRSHQRLQQNTESLKQWLVENPEFSIVLPQTGTVGFLKYGANIPSKKFAIHLLDECGVFYVPGSCFDCEYHLRLGLTAEPSLFKKGLQLTKQYLPK